MSQPIEQIASLTVGTVESVSPSEIKILLDTNAPQATALNTGVPTGFPRINSYLLIPNESGAVVGLIVWLGVERSSFPKRIGMKDFGLIDLPFPLRKVIITPLGTLTVRKDQENNENIYELERGVLAFPSVGDLALLPTAKQLRGIVQASKPEDRRIKIGTSSLSANADITVDPDKLFGRHLAVLGNTGSGKSCSVAGLIRWSLEAAKKENKNSLNPINARFIILDPNGEYHDAFKDLGTRIFTITDTPQEKEKALVVPAWSWNSYEWAAFGRAAPGIQRPLLGRALREVRSGGQLNEPIEMRLHRMILTCTISCRNILRKGSEAYSDFPGCKNFGLKLARLIEDMEQYLGITTGKINQLLSVGLDVIKQIHIRYHAPYFDRKKNEQVNDSYNPFSETDIKNVITALETILKDTGGDTQVPEISEDAPIPFDTKILVNHLEQIAEQVGETQRMESLLLRMRMLLADGRLGPVVNSPLYSDLAKWLDDYIGNNQASNGNIAILDLSLISPEVLNTIIAVIARLVFEATLRYRKLYKEHKELPVVLVLEEAHNFIRKGGEAEDGPPSPSQMCRQTFERIAREGRKFGLGLVLSSQRPSELSPTVLSQCNTFLLHRIVNDQDQELLGKLVPDNLKGLLNELPTLPSRQAILLGWAAPVPVLVEMTKLEEKQCPRSSDPHFWNVWTGQEERTINWNSITSDWMGIPTSEQSSNDGSS
jgi:DNA helicase HerA-like ATPase